MSQNSGKTDQSKQNGTECFGNKRPLPETYVHYFSCWWNMICGPVNEQLFHAGVGITSNQHDSITLYGFIFFS